MLFRSQHACDEGQAQARIDVRARAAEADEVELVVADNGRGIAADMQSRVFEPFFTTRRMSGGSGLGLHIVHQIVTRQLGGSVTLESAPGRGARFLIRVPRVMHQAPDIGRMLGRLPEARRDEP